jgi:hypothetical protein
MKNSTDLVKFSFWITITSIGLGIFSYVITRFEPFKGYLTFLIWSIVIFLVIIWFTLLLAANFSQKNDEKKFLGLAYINFLVKFVVVVAIPMYYTLTNNLPNTNFIIPYIVIYAVFTIVETYFLSGRVRFR